MNSGEGSSANGGKMTGGNGHQVKRSALAMAVLLLLGDEPMHPYGLRQRIQQWDKDRVVNVTQRNAIYQVMDRLERSGLIAVKETTRNERRPERTIYEATENGILTAKQWLQEMLRVPETAYPEFPAALAFLLSLGRDAVLSALDERVEALRAKMAEFDKEYEEAVATMPEGVEIDRIYIVEAEYIYAMWQAEADWVAALAADIRDGKLGRNLR
jgi:DNA-binding PadR family transcriptional regulator